MAGCSDNDTVGIGLPSSDSQDLELCIDQLNSEGLQKDRELAELRRQNEELSRQLSLTAQETDNIMEQRDRENELLGRNHEEIAEERRRLYEENDNAQRGLIELQVEIDQLKQTMMNYESQLGYRQKAIDALTAQCQDTHRKIGSCGTKLTDMELAIKQLEKKSRASEVVVRILLEDLQFTDIRLGQGAFGEVQVGTWEWSTVAFKTFSTNVVREPTMGRVFQSELVYCSKLLHPHIATVFGFTRIKGGPVGAIMEVLQGSLNDVLDATQSYDQCLTLREQLDVICDCLRGLYYLHNLPSCVIHGDVRPSNILITPTMTAKIIDLGESRFTDTVWFAQYVSPERAEKRPLTPATDVFSMGLTMCEMFTSVKPNYAARQAQLEAVPHADLRSLCVQMTYRAFPQRISLPDALRGVQHVIDTPDYWNCKPKRMVRGKLDGPGGVTLVQRPW